MVGNNVEEAALYGRRSSRDPSGLIGFEPAANVMMGGLTKVLSIRGTQLEEV